ncbi:hypothetical protein EMCRGX_G032794 [Ephydatia muelleri]
MWKVSILFAALLLITVEGRNKVHVHTVTSAEDGAEKDVSYVVNAEGKAIIFGNPANAHKNMQCNTTLLLGGKFNLLLCSFHDVITTDDITFLYRRDITIKPFHAETI